MVTTQYPISGVGLHYAVNPTYSSEMGYVPEMEQHTVDVLRDLDERRPGIVLMPCRDNSCDPHAVIIYAEGQNLGYVARRDLPIFHNLLKSSGKKFLVGTISRVEVKERGKLYLTLEGEEGLENAPIPWEENTWPEWGEKRPLLPVKGVWMARIEAEFMIDNMELTAADSRTVEKLERYLRVWMENALYDISEDIFRTCERFIRRFAEHPHPDIRQWAGKLDDYRSGFYGAKREVLRMQWWESLKQSKAMEVLWRDWQYHVSYHIRQGLREIDTYLRCLPDRLYSLIGQPDCLFKSLYYRNVPRQVLWGIYTALLLRIRTCQKLHIEMRPLPEDSYEYGHALADTAAAGTEAVSMLPEVLRTDEAEELLDKFQRAGMLDPCAQPVNLSNAERGLLAKTLSDELDIEKPWKVFGETWCMNSETLRRAYNKALDQAKSLTFQDRLKEILNRP